MTQSKKRLGLAVPESLYQDLRQKAEYQGKNNKFYLSGYLLVVFRESEEGAGQAERRDKEVRRWTGLYQCVLITAVFLMAQ